jgi:hypothetical protein
MFFLLYAIFDHPYCNIHKNEDANAPPASILLDMTTSLDNLQIVQELFFDLAAASSPFPRLACQLTPAR